MAKLGDMSRATLYLACLPGGAKHASDRPATCPPSHGDKKCFLLSPRTISVSLAATFVARYKVSEVAKLGDIEGTCHERQCLVD